MYIKFCRRYGEDKKDEASTNLSSESKLSVELEGEKGNQTQGNVGLWRAACLCLGIVCLVLLLVTLVLTVKLQNGSTVCSDRQETTAVDGTIPAVTERCSFEWCQDQFPRMQPRRLGCQQCADGWLTVDQACFFLSTFRLSWDESQRNCTSRGGSLAVISSQKVQSILSEKGNLKYWIGLRHRSSWTWVNNNQLEKSYWSDAASEGQCVMLNTERPADKNWVAAACQGYTYFICQLQL